MIRRVNRGRGHSYVDTDTGEKIPGVTTILGDGVPKPALVGWAGNVTAEYAVDHWDELAAMPPSKRLKELQQARYADRDAAANRGTQVHTLASHLVHGVDVEVPDALRGHVESYVRFLDEEDIQPVLVEACVVNWQHRYAGTLDLIANARRRAARLLFDVKTARRGVFADNGLQLAGYRYAEAYLDITVTPPVERPMLDVDGCAVVHVRADGYTVVPVDTGPDIFRYFLYAQQMRRWAVDISDTVLGDPWAAPPRVVQEVA